MRWHSKIQYRKRSQSPIANLPSLGTPTGEIIKIQQIRSPIGNLKSQGETLKSLGLRRIGHIVEKPNNASVHGQIRKVQHLVRILT